MTTHLSDEVHVVRELNAVTSVATSAVGVLITDATDDRELLSEALATEHFVFRSRKAVLFRGTEHKAMVHLLSNANIVQITHSGVTGDLTTTSNENNVCALFHECGESVDNRLNGSSSGIFHPLLPAIGLVDVLISLVQRVVVDESFVNVEDNHRGLAVLEDLRVEGDVLVELGHQDAHFFREPREIEQKRICESNERREGWETRGLLTYSFVS
mgnify:CR=1 FL=1